MLNFFCKRLRGNVKKKIVTAADCLILSQISVISLRAVSAPSEKSVPGTLLLKQNGTFYDIILY
jgi:hypothetical protein